MVNFGQLFLVNTKVALTKVSIRISVYNDDQILIISVNVSKVSTPLVIETLQSAQIAGRHNGLNARLFFNFSTKVCSKMEIL